jgi:glutaredoxin
MVWATMTVTCPYCRFTMQTDEPAFEEHQEACRSAAEHRAAMSYQLGSHSWMRAAGQEYLPTSPIVCQCRSMTRDGCRCGKEV